VRQADRTRRSTEALLDAAGDLIVERGFGALTLAAIGERAGFSRGLVTARFGSKHGLIDAVLDRIFMRWEQAKDEPGSGSLCGRDRILRMIGVIHSGYLLDPRPARVLWALMFEAVGPDDALRERIVQFHDQLRLELAGYLELGRADGSVRSEIDPQAEAIQLLAEIRGLAYQAMLEPDRFDLHQALCHAEQVLLDRIAPQSAAAPTR
jgi:AcrR family transcriptional regulator